MQRIQPVTRNAQQTFSSWYNEARRVAAGNGYAQDAVSASLIWSMSLDVHVQQNYRSQCLLGTACEITTTGLSFRCRESLSIYHVITLCRAGELEGIKAKIVDKKETIGGFVYEVRCEAERVERKAGTVAAA